MHSIPALSPLTTSAQPNASIVFQGEAFPIFKEIFITYSRTACQLERLGQSTFVVTSPVTRDSAEIFVDICQGKSRPVDKSQILDLLSLCEEWSVDSLKDYLLNLIENDDDQILTSLRYAIDRNFATDEYEARARHRFRQLVDKDELFDLPISVLRRIVDVGLQDTDFEKLFDFLRRCLNRFGSFGSVLFQGVNLRHFSVSQLQELTDRHELNWCYLSDSVCDTLSLCMSEMAKHRMKFEEEHRQLCDLQAEYRRVVSDYETARRVQNDRLSSVEASLSGFEGRLSLVESNSLPRSEIEARYAEKSDLKSNYATISSLQSNYLTTADLQRFYATKSELASNYAQKPDLQSNYLTKSEVDRIYARKADVETNYATKSNLQSDYLTKADSQEVYLTRSDIERVYAQKSDLQTNYQTKVEANSLELRCASKAFVDEQLAFLKLLTGSFPLIPGSPLNGIIHHLTLECGGNVHDRGVVSITADRPWDDSSGCAAKNIADLEANSVFYCADAADMWVCYDFKARKVALTDYSIRSRYDHAQDNLRSWVIEVSNDGAHWMEADRRQNRDELCAQNVVRSFAVSRPSVGRYVRLRQIGPNDRPDFETLISGWELFGALTR
jgi:hypothetical protein